MSVWASQQGRQVQSDDGAPIVNTTNVVFNVTTNNEGEFSIDLTQLNFAVEQVLDVRGVVLGQVLSAVVDIVDIASVLIVDVTETLITGVVVLGQTITSGLTSSVKSIRRAGSDINVRVTALIVRA